MKQTNLPMGGIGAGYLVLDRSGRLYNRICESETTAALLDYTYPSIRIVSDSGERFMRALCTRMRGTNCNVDSDPIMFLEEDELKCTFQYPTATYQMKSRSLPFDITWTYYVPVIPYDHVAAAMPVVLLAIRVQNNSAAPATVSPMMCVDNLVLATCGPGNVTSASHAVRITPGESAQDPFVSSVFRGSLANAPREVLEKYGFNAVLFGERRQAEKHHQLHACLAVRETPNTMNTLSFCSTQEGQEYLYAMEYYANNGRLPFEIRSEKANYGAVCSTCTIKPRESHRFDYVIAWHMPENSGFDVKSNSGYKRHFSNATDTARHGMKYFAYMHGAVENWQKQLMDSNLPKEFSLSLIDCTRALSTNVQHTHDGQIVFHSSNALQEKSTERWNILAAFSLLCFMPRYHTVAVAAKLLSLSKHDRQGSPDDAYVHEFGQLLISACSDAMLNGSRAKFSQWYEDLASTGEFILNSYFKERMQQPGVASCEYITNLGIWYAAFDALSDIVSDHGGMKNVNKYKNIAKVFSAQYLDKIELLLGSSNLAKNTFENEDAKCRAEYAYEIFLGPCCSGLLQLRSHGWVKDKIEKTMRAYMKSDCEMFMKNQGRFRRNVVLTLVRLSCCSDKVYGMREIAMMLGNLNKSYSKLYDDSGPTTSTPCYDILSMWSVLHALVGFNYDAINQSIMMRPTIRPENALMLPVFSPLFLGQIRITSEGPGGNTLCVRLTVQTPLPVQSIQLHLPLHLSPVSITCTKEAESIPLKQEITSHEESSRVFIKFLSTIEITGVFVLRLSIDRR